MTFEILGEPCFVGFQLHVFVENMVGVSIPKIVHLISQMRSASSVPAEMATALRLAVSQ